MSRTVAIARSASSAIRAAPLAVKVTAALLLVAAAINLALTSKHFEPPVLYQTQRGDSVVNVTSASPAYGIFFLVASIAQVVLAAALLARPRPFVFRIAVLSSVGMIAGWLVVRATAPPLAPGPVTFAGVIASSIELAALVLLAVSLPIGRPASADGPRFAKRWAALFGLTFAPLFLFASGSLAHVPFDLAKERPVPWINVDTSNGFSFLSPWISIAFSKHLELGISWAVAAFLVIAVVLVSLSAGLIVGLARTGACRPQASGVAAVAPAFFAVQTCCGASLPIGATLGGATLLPLISATPWLLLGDAILMIANLLLLRRRWRAASKEPRRRSERSFRSDLGAWPLPHIRGGRDDKAAKAPAVPGE